MNVVLAVNNKTLERFINALPQVNVLTTITKREQILDVVLARNPHTLVLAATLPGRTDLREIVEKLKAAKPQLKIVFLYGEPDNEHKAFLDFLVRNGVYDFIVGDIVEADLVSAILQNAQLDDVKQYLIGDVPSELPQYAPAPQIVSPVEKETSAQGLELLIVEKIVEHTVTKTQYLGNVVISIASLFDRAGSTHTAFVMTRALSDSGYNVALVTDDTTCNALNDYYAAQGSINGVRWYDNEITACNAAEILVKDVGKLNEDNSPSFYKSALKLLICPSAPWEIDALTNFLRDNELASSINYIFYPISEKHFKELQKNLQKGGCMASRMNCEPDLFAKTNDKSLLLLAENVLKHTALRKKKGHKSP